jgi:hypothetical protein
MSIDAWRGMRKRPTAPGWRLPGSCRIEVLEADRTPVWRIRLAAATLDRVALGLCMLRHGVVSRLDLVDERGATSLKIGLLGSLGEGSATVRWEAYGATLALLPVELEAWMHFLLRTVRDGVAEVNHFDLEAISELEGRRSGHFVIEFPGV